MIEIEDTPSKTQITRKRRFRPVDTSPKILVETPEQRQAKEAREAREVAEKAMYDAVLLIQCHERARVGRRIGKEGNLKKKEISFYNSLLS